MAKANKANPPSALPPTHPGALLGVDSRSPQSPSFRNPKWQISGIHATRIFTYIFNGVPRR